MNYTKISELPLITTVSDPTTAVLPIVESGTTSQISVNDLASSRRNYASVYTELDGANWINGGFGPLSLGDNDLYTVPIGKSALISGGNVFNPTVGGNITFFAEIKHNGTYYRASSSNANVADGISVLQAISSTLVLNAGDTFAQNTATTAGGYCSFSILEFNATSALKGAFVFGTNNGDNTLYTCPSGKTASTVSLTGGFSARPIVSFATGAVAVVSIFTKLVKSGGGSVQLNATVSSAGANILANNMTIGGVSITSGDVLAVNVTTGDSAQSMNTAILELDA